MHKLLEEKLLPVICSVRFGNWNEVIDGEWWPSAVYMVKYWLQSYQLSNKKISSFTSCFSYLLHLEILSSWINCSVRSMCTNFNPFIFTDVVEFILSNS
jgi:hypothetical protein